ncbi:MAG: substrate-binding domain-containing protein, partial [Opitutaceae bacterium]|nr:substrate-binding domain-containing protein [Verrucomicrobiales bacterium]
FVGGVQPPGFLELTNQVWRGRVALAYPMFGTTGTHFLVLRQRWGEKAWLDWCRALQANKPLLVDGNSVVVKMVGRGEAWIGLTDSDDVMAGAQDGLPVASVPINLARDGLQIPNTVAILRSAPHPSEAQQLSDYLRGDGVYQYLFEAGALQGRTMTLNAGVPINWTALLETQQAGLNQLKEIFLR